MGFPEFLALMFVAFVLATKLLTFGTEKKSPVN
jgi:hypothetical protein